MRHGVVEVQHPPLVLSSRPRPMASARPTLADPALGVAALSLAADSRAVAGSARPAQRSAWGPPDRAPPAGRPADGGTNRPRVPPRSWPADRPPGRLRPR